MNSVERFPFPEFADLPDDLRERIDAVAAKTGFIPNVFLVMARRPDEFRAFFAYHDALMEKESGLTKAEREMIVVATSAANDCPYCVVAHGAVLRIRAKDPLIADQVAVNHRTAPVTERQRVMLEVAVKLARTPERAAIDRSRTAPCLRVQRRGHLGYWSHRLALRPLQPDGPPHRPATQRRVYALSR